MVSAHGDKQEWQAPQFTAAQVATLTNTGKYFFAVGNCCLTGNFNNTSTSYSPGSAIGTTACFAETMIRVPNAGAIAYIGNSPVSYWFEDFYWAIGTGVNFNSNTYQLTGTPTTANTTMGVYDAMFIDEYWNSASSLLNIGDIAVASAHETNYLTSVDANYYWLYYHVFGDGSIMPYITKPEVNNVTIPASVMTGATSMTVNAIAGSYVAVTDNESTIYGVAVANSSGVATVNFTNAIPATGTLYVVVTRQQYQPYFGTVAVVAPNPPTADFTGTPTTILERESVTFTNNSQYAASYLWNFGDGQTSTEANPVHTYMTQGTYTVSLYVENPLGNHTKTETNYITVNPNTNPPVADFVASETEISVGTTITFTDLTENIVSSWAWTFEGGTPATSTEQNPTVTYNEPGNYTVTLVATNAYSSDTETKVGYITVLYPEINMSNETITTCGGIYRDPGGDSDYENNANFTQTIYPSTEGAMVRLTFNSFALQASSGYYGCRDKLYIYDGTSTSANVLVNGVCGTTNPGTVTATNDAGALTIVFTSNGSTTAAGWEAEISCYMPGPEVAVQSYTPTSARYNTTNDLNVTFVNNGGMATSASTTATLSTTDEYLTLNTTTATLGTMDRNATANGTFNFTMAENVPDGHVATINVAIADGSNSWNETITITAVGPACEAPTGLQVAVNNTEATITWDTQTIATVTISDDFEDHTHGTINSAGSVGWTYIDGDNTNTGTFSTIEFTNESSKMAFIVLDGSQITGQAANVTAHSGNNFIGAPYANNVQNDDWIVSPELNFTEDFNFSFYARSFSSNYSTEKFYAAYSTTGNSAEDFINLNNSATTTTTTWTEYSYIVPANAKYVAIHCISSDMFIFCVDDITISGNALTGAASVNLYDNGVLIASNITTGTYTATDLALGEHCFSIRAVCNDDSESLAAQSCVTIDNNLPSYTVAVNSNNGGTVSPNGTQTVYEGGNFTFTVTPNDCYEVASVTVDGNNVNLTNNQYTISNVTTDHTVNVTFDQIIYTIIASASNGGTITPDGDVSVNCGESKTFAIAANTGYFISDVTVDGESVGTQNSYTFSNVTTNHTISATFLEIPEGQIVITINADAEGGSVSPTGTQIVTEGEDFTFTVTPDACYTIGTVTVNGTPVELEANNSYTIPNVTTEQTINVTFNQIVYTIAASAGNGGTITPAGDIEVVCGNDATFTITPDEGYEIADVVVDGQSAINDISSYATIGASASYTFNYVTENGHSIYVTFIERTDVPDCNAVTNLTVEANAYGTTGNLLTWTAAENAESYLVYRNGVLVSTNSETTYFDVEGGQNIGYYVVTNCGNGNMSDPSETVVSPVIEQCNTVESLEVSVESFGNLISWNAVENAVSYNVFRNNETIANISTTSYADMNGQEGDTYYIVTICQYGESDPSESIQAIQTGIDETSVSVEIYPNPASDKFMIECEGITTIEIFNVVGQSMGMINVNSSAISVDSSDWTNGVYSVRITTENSGIIVKQIIKQ